MNGRRGSTLVKFNIIGLIIFIMTMICLYTYKDSIWVKAYHGVILSCLNICYSIVVGEPAFMCHVYLLAKILGIEI